MKSKVLKAITLCLALGLTTGLSATVVSLTHLEANKAKNLPELLLIGDAHIDEKNDAAHKKVLMEQIERWAKQDGSMLFLLESSKSFLAGYKKGSYDFMLADLARHFTTEEFRITTKSGKMAFANKSVRFFLADERGPALRTLIDFEKNFDKTFFDNLGTLFKTKPDRINDALEGVLQTSTDSTSAQALLKEIEANLRAIKTYRDTLATTSNAYKTTDHFHQVVATSFEKAKTFFNAQLTRGELTQPHSVARAFINAWKKTKKYETLSNNFEQWAHPLEQVIADAGFVERVTKNQTKFPKIVLFCGNRHALAVKNALIHGFGYSPTLELGKQVQSSSYNPFTSEQLGKIFSAVFVSQQPTPQQGTKSVTSTSSRSASTVTTYSGLIKCSDSSGLSSSISSRCSSSLKEEEKKDDK